MAGARSQQSEVGLVDETRDQLVIDAAAVEGAGHTRPGTPASRVRGLYRTPSDCAYRAPVPERGDNQDAVRAAMSVNRDVRAVRTRRKLVAAYRELVTDRPGDVSVSQVVKRAGVTRSSFYAHFRDASDLAVAALTEVFDVVASVDNASRRRGDERLDEVSEHSLAQVIGFIEARRDVYRQLLTRGNRFAAAVEDAFTERNLATLAATGSTSADPLVTARFVAAGVMGVVSWWLREQPGRTAEELAAQLARVIPADFTQG